MFRLLRAFRRWLRNVFSGAAGEVDEAAEAVLRENPHAVRDRFEEVTEDRIRDLNRLQDAMTRMTATRRREFERLKRMLEKIETFRKTAKGYGIKARNRLEELRAKGLTDEQIKADAEILKGRGAFTDHTKSADELGAEAQSLQASLEQMDQNLDGMERNILALDREIRSIRSKSEETIAALIAAKQVVEASKIQRGVSSSKTGKDLEQLDRIRAEAYAAIDVTHRLDRTDSLVGDEEALALADQDTHGSEFDQLLFGAKVADEQAAAEKVPVAQPEAVTEKAPGKFPG
ncbi:MAG: hypothetical protein HY520_01450 [Candidatus Aenigmarchaeota archaeon]|nr:hypothetical protein [Candidatus Aenigmarchaeota archaeon]